MIEEMIKEIKDRIKENYSEAKNIQTLATEKRRELDNLIENEKRLIVLLDVQFKKYEELSSLIGENIDDEFYMVGRHISNKID